MKNYITSSVRIALAVFLLCALSCTNHEDSTSVTVGSESEENGANNTGSTSAGSVTIDQPRQPNSTGTPAIQVDPTDGNGSIHMGAGAGGNSSNTAHSNTNK